MPDPETPKTPEADAQEKLQAELKLKEQEVAQYQEALRASQELPAPAPSPNQSWTKEQVEAEYYKDPISVTGAVAAHRVQQEMKAFQAQQAPGLETTIELARGMARGTTPEEQALFDKYRPEIEEQIKQSRVPPHFLANVHVWRNAFNVVKGQKMSEILRAHTPTPGRDDGPSPPTRSSPMPTPGPLSEEERKMAAGLGISEEEYQEGKKDVSIGPTGESIIDSEAWGQVMTFDSRKKRRQERQRANA